jgi:hypothetical protein
MIEKHGFESRVELLGGPFRLCCNAGIFSSTVREPKPFAWPF